MRAGINEAELDGLMDRYARGDHAVFPALHRMLAPAVRGLLLRLTGRPALADDLSQEVFLRIHRARGAFGEGAAALPWVYAIARNVFIDSTRRKQETLEDEASPPSRPGHAPLPDQVAEGRQTLAVVKDAIARLPVAQREALVLLRFEGMSVAEAAQILGATESAVKLRAFRAYEALRAVLEKMEGS
jgi:RNA polymerase sigma-70 factor (ECF subfamily)